MSDDKEMTFEEKIKTAAAAKLRTQSEIVRRTLDDEGEPEVRQRLLNDLVARDRVITDLIVKVVMEWTGK